MPAFQMFATGQAIVPTGTATALSEIPANPVAGEGFAITLRALSTNTAPIYYGAEGVTDSTGAELTAGQQVTLYLNNLDLIYVISGTASQKVSWAITEFY